METGHVVVGNPGSRRVEFWQAALAAAGEPAARVIAYWDWLEGRVRLPEVVRAGDVVRIESPGKDWVVEKKLLEAGFADWTEEEWRLDWWSEAEVRGLEFEKGRLWASRQWYCGWRAVLRRIGRELEGCPGQRVVNGVREIEVMFDKVACRERMIEADVRVPNGLGITGSFEELRYQMTAAGVSAVFVKLAHGSSAAGVVAYRTDGRRHQAFTTVEMVEREGERILYNTRAIRELRNEREIAVVVDELCRHRVVVEAWVPKAGLGGKVFDVRIVVIAGKARHTVVRLSTKPMTNLHLLNDRSGSEAVRELVGEERWSEGMRMAEAAAGCFPGAMYAGVDLMFSAGSFRPYVLEINAFGDLLPGCLDEGMDTYGAELEAVRC